MKSFIFNLPTLLIIYFLFFNSINVNSQNCIDFNDTIISEEIPTTQTTFVTWYEYNDIVFQAVYNDDLNMGYNGSVNIDDLNNAGYNNANSNFSGNIFYQGDVITKIDFSNIGYQQKTVNFDINNILDESSDNPFYVNGNDTNNLPSGVSLNITNLTNGKHVELTGDISFIEIHGFEIAIDNLCVDSASGVSVNTNDVDNFMSIFPNPAKTDLQIKWKQKTKISLELFNLTGKPVMHVDKIYGNNYILNIESLKAGIYFLRINDGKNTIVKKIIKF